MSRIIEAEARITAFDATGRTFEQVAQKVRGLQSAFKSLGHVSTAGIGNLNKTITKLQHAVHTLAPAAAGAAAMEGARGLSGLVHSTVKNTAARAHERVREEVAGFTDAELDEAERISDEVSKRNKALSTTTIMHSLRNLTSIVGTFEEAAKLIDPIAKLRVVTLGAHPERREELEADFDKLEKSQEMVGATQDPARFRKNMDLVAKGMNVFGDTLRPSDIYDFAKYARQAGQSYDDRFLLGVAPTLMQEMGGKSAGEALASFYQQFVAGKMPEYAAQLMDKYGLIGDRSKIEFNKAGKIKRLMPGAIKGHELAKNDPYRWMQEVYLPALAAHGVTSKEDIENVTAIIAGKRTTGQAMGIFSTQQQRIEKDLARTGNAKGLEAADTFVGKDPMMAWEAVTAQFQNLLAAAGGPLAEPAARGLNMLADAIIALENAAQKHPYLGAAGLVGSAGALGLGGLAASVLALRGIGGMLGLGGKAAVADLSGDAAIAAMQAQLGAAGPGFLGTVLGSLAFPAGAAAFSAAELNARGRGQDTFFSQRGTPANAIGPLPWIADAARAVFGGGGKAESTFATIPRQAAEVKGSAELNVNVQVEPSDSFISRIVTAIKNEINAFGGGGPGSGVGTAGSTGLSMPEAVPPP